METSAEYVGGFVVFLVILFVARLIFGGER